MALPIEHRCGHADEKLQKHFQTIQRDTAKLYSPKPREPKRKRRASRQTNEEHLIRITVGRTDPMSPENKDKQFSRSMGNHDIWKPIRIVVDISHLVDPKKVCTAVGDVRPNYIGSDYVCEAEDVMTAEKLNFIQNVTLPLAVFLTQQFLNTKPLDDPLFVEKDVCGSGVDIPDSHVEDGVDDVDFLLYAHAAGEERTMSDGSNVVAWAGHCARDLSGRPLIGQVNIVPSFIPWYGSAAEKKNYVGILIHELFHALGFTSSFLKSWTKITKRRGKEVHLVTAPEVVDVAKEHLNCSTLEGVELEDEGGSGTALSHWERRHWRNDIMTGLSGAEKVSRLTLAFFNTLSFYKANMLRGEPLVWGRNAGCGFVEKRCTADSPRMGFEWCDPESRIEYQCSHDRTAIGTCPYALARNLSDHFRYFGNTSMVGLGAMMDHCPIVMSVKHGECRDRPTAGERGLYRSYYGPQSRCIQTTNMVSPEPGIEKTRPRCFRVRCPLGKRLEVLVGSTWVSCPADGSAGSVKYPPFSGFFGEMKCERADVVCTPELFYHPNGSFTDLGPLREIALDVFLTFNSTVDDARGDAVDDLGRVISRNGGYVFIHFHEELARLASLDLGARNIRLLPEHAAATFDGGVVAYFQLGVKIGEGGEKLEEVRNKFGAALTAGRIMTRLGAYIAMASGRKLTMTLAASKISSEANILDGPASLTQLVTLGNLTIHCFGNVDRISRLLGKLDSLVLEGGLRKDISQLLHLTPDLVEIGEIRILNSGKLVVNAKILFPSFLESVEDPEKIVQFWFQRLKTAVRDASALSALSSAIRILSKRAPVGFTERASSDTFSLRFASLNDVYTVSASGYDPRCVVQFYNCFVIHVTLYFLTTLVGVTLLVLIFLRCFCTREKNKDITDL